MLVLLVRHAQADEQSAEKYPDDTLRPLVASGRRTQRRMSRLLLRQEVAPERVYSSPWKRAWQTARILVRETGLGKSARVVCNALAAPPDVRAIAAEVGEVAADATIALVGHEPWMSDLASQLLTGSSSGVRIDFPKSAVMGIDMEKLETGGGTLRFFVVP